jgi:hypothetical protein
MTPRKNPTFHHRYERKPESFQLRWPKNRRIIIDETLDPNGMMKMMQGSGGKNLMKMMAVAEIE